MPRLPTTKRCEGPCWKKRPFKAFPKGSKLCRRCLEKQNKPSAKENTFKAAIRFKYDLTVEQFRDMLRKQNGRCAICNELLVKPHVDHDHLTNEVRGLLCLCCNTGLGMFKDDPERLERAITYLN